MLPKEKRFSISQFSKKHGESNTIAYLELWLTDLNDSVNLKNKMTGGQIQATAEAIYDQYYMLTIPDLTLFFKNIKNGVYGQFYESLDRFKIMEWLKEYFDLRCETAMLMGERHKERFNVNSDKMHPDVIKKMFEGVGEKKIDHKLPVPKGIGYRHREKLLEKLRKLANCWSDQKINQYLDEIARGESGTCDFKSYQMLSDILFHRNQ